MKFNDTDLANIIAVQRNNAQNEAAQANAVILTLQAELKAKDEEIAALKATKAKKK